MYQVIARKYRPQTFADLLGQEHVRTTLSNAIRQNRIAHGYIFSGQRGTGKTTVARIMARCLNCIQGPTDTPCGVCASCRETTAGNAVDCIEIDAASNRGINEMRELRESVRYRPARDRYKVFIIDEAHQITTEAFNALLKTLEEPPEWVVFILCTTEAHKIPATIASRCQQFSFRSVEFDALIERMEEICRQEGVAADPEALAVLAQAGEGSVRDSLSALDQAIASTGTTLDAEAVRELLGLFSLNALAPVTDALLQGDGKRMLEIVQELERNGRSLQHYCRELARYMRNLLVVRIAGGDTRLVAATPSERERLATVASSFTEEDLTRYLQLTLDLFKDLQFSLQPRLHLELGLVRLVQAGRLFSVEQALAALQSGAGSPAVAALVEARPTAAVPARTAPAVAPPATRPAPTPVSKLAELQSLARPAPPRPVPAPSPSPPERQDSAAPTGPAVATAPAPQPEPPAASDLDLRQRLHKALEDAGKTFAADAIASSDVAIENGVCLIVCPPATKLALREAELQPLVNAAAGRAVKIRITVGQPAGAAPPAAPARRQDDDTTRRALAHPEVQRFQELFPGSEVRDVRDLKQ